MKYYQILFVRIITITFIVTFLNVCNNNSAQNQHDLVTEPEKMNQKISDHIQDQLKIALDKNGRLNDSIKLSMLQTVNTFYQNNQFQNIWSNKENWVPLADSLIRFIQLSKEFGLFPKDYHDTELQSLVQNFALDTLITGSRRDALLWTNADLMLTDAFFRISSHLHLGRLGIDSVYMNPDSSLTDSFYHKNLNDVLVGKDLKEAFHAMEPKHHGYQTLRIALKAFLDTANFKSTYTYVSYPFKDSSLFIKTLVKRLKEESAISWQAKTVDSTELANAILKVQRKRKLKADGKFGVQLIRSLNNNDQEKFKRIAINLDRYKKLPSKMPDRFIWVNLPAYQLQLWDHDSLKLESKVIVGKPATRTPLLTSQISDLVTFPQWTIPNSIILKEILPALKRNPGYLYRKGFMLMTWKDEIIDPYSVNWAKYKKGIPYRIVQGSGDDNALGILKFNFPNKYAVYLHDTNQRYLFKNESRALSHGCVRVQQWEKLAYYISGLDSMNFQNDSSRIQSDSIKVWLERKEKHKIPVKSKLPVYFRYFTTEVKKGKIIFYEDIYGEDKAAREAYFQLNKF